MGRKPTFKLRHYLLLTHDAQANALRYCDFDRPVQFLPTGHAVCSFAGGVRERR